MFFQLFSVSATYFSFLLYPFFKDDCHKVQNKLIFVDKISLFKHLIYFLSSIVNKIRGQITAFYFYLHFMQHARFYDIRFVDLLVPGCSC